MSTFKKFSIPGFFLSIILILCGYWGSKDLMFYGALINVLIIVSAIIVIGRGEERKYSFVAIVISIILLLVAVYPYVFLGF